MIFRRFFFSSSRSYVRCLCNFYKCTRYNIVLKHTGGSGCTSQSTQGATPPRAATHWTRRSQPSTLPDEDFACRSLCLPYCSLGRARTIHCCPAHSHRKKKQKRLKREEQEGEKEEEEKEEKKKKKPPDSFDSVKFNQTFFNSVRLN